MRLWRLVDHRFAASPLTGHGTNLDGGRWNSPGRRVVCTAPSKASANLELIAANPWRVESSRKFVLLRMDVPDAVSRETVRLVDFPPDWSSSPEATRKIGDRWLVERRTCILRVPSVTVPGDANYLINPEHADFELLFARPPEAWDSFEEYQEGELAFQGDASLDRNPIRKDLVRAAASFGPKDLFICHAAEDRPLVVVPLRDTLFEYGISSWVDFAEITIGDSIIEKVNEGLTSARHVLVVISPAFLKQPRPKQQLRAAVERETREGEKVVLPMLVNYPDESVDFAAAIPIGADKYYYTWGGDPYAAAAEIVRAVRPQVAKIFAQ